jgi:Fe-Mn family superoxide dismutase
VGCGKKAPPEGKTALKPAKSYEVQDFSALKGMAGFSDEILENHMILYKGYVEQANSLLAKTRALSKGKANTVEYAELKRRLGFEFNAMRLHDCYFRNLGGNGQVDKKSDIYQAISMSFGSFEKWKKDFTATAMIRGSGWAILYADPMSGRLMNVWVDEHDVNNPVGCMPMVVLDCWEHAYMTDYGLDRAKYVEAFFNNLNWEFIAQKFGCLLTVREAIDKMKAGAEAVPEEEIEHEGAAEHKAEAKAVHEAKPTKAEAEHKAVKAKKAEAEHKAEEGKAEQAPKEEAKAEHHAKAEPHAKAEEHKSAHK